MHSTCALRLRSKNLSSNFLSFQEVQSLVQSQTNRYNLMFIGTTVAALFLIKWRFNTKNNHILQKHNSDYAREVRLMMSDILQSFDRINEMWPEYAKLKEENIRHLQSQNIQQKRSMDRLSAALKLC